MSLSYVRWGKDLIKWNKTWVSKKWRHFIKETPNYRKTVLGKCPVFQERMPQNLCHPIIIWQRSQGCCMQINNKGLCWNVWQWLWSHQVDKRVRPMLNFCKRMVLKELLNVRKDLIKLLMGDLQQTGQGKLYVNQS